MLWDLLFRDLTGVGRGRVSQHPRVHVLLPCARLEPGCGEETHTGKSVPFPRACFCCCHFSLKCLFCLFLPSQVLKTLRMLRVSMPTSVPRVSRSPYHHACLVPSAVLNGFAHGHSVSRRDALLIFGFLPLPHAQTEPQQSSSLL